jgi:DNA-binding NtrC family response regulator
MKKFSILVVDDEENVSRLLGKVLLKEGFNVYTASDGNEALSIIDSQRVDIVITDIKMPGMNGIELLEAIKEADTDIKVILITAFATVETAVEALRAGASDYITKPFNLDEVMLSVRKIIPSIEGNDTDINDVKSTQPIENYIISESNSMKKLMELIKQVADTRVTVMVYGETGTGKELAAKALHNLSTRSEKPFIKVNCAAIPETLLESELFGFEKGAFTGAIAKKPGKFELADGGSIFLDEIGDIAPSIQAKLLRVIQEKEFERLGGTITIRADVRIIAATNKNLEELVKLGKFRQDLYYRLNVIPIFLPPLRERKEDIGLLINHFLKKSSAITGKPSKMFSEKALSSLLSYSWPGNVRELENIIERCVVVTPGETIDTGNLPVDISNYTKNEDSENESVSRLDNIIDNAEKNIILKTLDECGGNRTKASEKLGISRRSLHRKLIKYGINE